MNDYLMPKHVCWDITSACNDSCRFCYRVTNQLNLKPSQHFELAEKFAKAGVHKVSLVGGEPLLIPHLSELLQYLRDAGITTSIVTNGILLEKALPKIKTHLDWITLPLDGYSSVTQEAMSRNPSHFDRVMRLTSIVLESGIKLKINSVLSRQNVETLQLLTERVMQINPDRWKIFEFSPIRGSAKENAECFSIPHEVFLKKSQEAAENAKLTGIHVTIADKAYLNGNYFSVNPDGKVRVTVHGEDQIAGDLLKSDVREIWNYKGFDKKRHWNARNTLTPDFYKMRPPLLKSRDQQNNNTDFVPK